MKRRDFFKKVALGASVVPMVASGGALARLAHAEAPEAVTEAPEATIAERPRHYILETAWWHAGAAPGSYYFNMASQETFTCVERDGFTFWEPGKNGFKCPKCVHTLMEDSEYINVAYFGLAKYASVVCNTWPKDGSAHTSNNCCCGHPWLSTAHEDNVRWRAGETDAERQERRNYPSVASFLVDKWYAHQAETPYKYIGGYIKQTEDRIERSPEVNLMDHTRNHSMYVTEMKMADFRHHGYSNRDATHHLKYYGYQHEVAHHMELLNKMGKTIK